MDRLRQALNDPSWNDKERQTLHDAWTERYSQSPPGMSPLGPRTPDGFLRGADGQPDRVFFDAASEFRHGLKQTPRGASAAHHQVLDRVENTYRDRQDRLNEQIRYGTSGPDLERLKTLQTAEQDAYKQMHTELLHGGQTTPEVTAARAQARDSFAALVDSDRRQGHPITDLNRDLHHNPPSLNEQRHWCTRNAEGTHGVPAGTARSPNQTKAEAAAWHLDHYQRETPAYASTSMVPDRLQHQVDQRHATERAQRNAHLNTQIHAHRAAQPATETSTGDGRNGAVGAQGTPGPGALTAQATPTFNPHQIKDRIASIRAQHQGQSPAVGGNGSGATSLPAASSTPQPPTAASGPRTVPPTSPATTPASPGATPQPDPSPVRSTASGPRTPSAPVASSSTPSPAPAPVRDVAPSPASRRPLGHDR